MAQITWLGSSISSPVAISQFGLTFPINVPVECDNDATLGKCWINQFYRVEGWSPEDGGDQPIRSDDAMATASPRVPAPPPLVKNRAKEIPPPLPDPEPDVADGEPVSIIVDDNGRVTEDEDLPAILSGAQKIDLDGDGQADLEIHPIDEPEPAAEPPRRRRRRRNAN